MHTILALTARDIRRYLLHWKHLCQNDWKQSIVVWHGAPLDYSPHSFSTGQGPCCKSTQVGPGTCWLHSADDVAINWLEATAKKAINHTVRKSCHSELNWQGFTSYSMWQNRSFRRRSWLTADKTKPNKTKLENTKPKWSKLTQKNTKPLLLQPFNGLFSRTT